MVSIVPQSAEHLKPGVRWGVSSAHAAGSALMDERDIIAALGPPDAILPARLGMVSTEWLCSQCCKLYVFDKPVRPPAPCECGGLAFERK